MNRPAAAQDLAHHRHGEDVVERIQALGPSDRTDEDQAGHEVGSARRELDGHTAAVAVADHGDRGGVALGDDLARSSALPAMLRVSSPLRP